MKMKGLCGQGVARTARAYPEPHGGLAYFWPISPQYGEQHGRNSKRNPEPYGGLAEFELRMALSMEINMVGSF